MRTTSKITLQLKALIPDRTHRTAEVLVLMKTTTKMRGIGCEQDEVVGSAVRNKIEGNSEVL